MDFVNTRNCQIFFCCARTVFLKLLFYKPKYIAIHPIGFIPVQIVYENQAKYTYDRIYKVSMPSQKTANGYFLWHVFLFAFVLLVKLNYNEYIVEVYYFRATLEKHQNMQLVYNDGHITWHGAWLQQYGYNDVWIKTNPKNLNYTH